MVVKAIVRGDQIMWVRNVSHNEKFATYYLKVNGERVKVAEFPITGHPGKYSSSPVGEPPQNYS